MAGRTGIGLDVGGTKILACAVTDEGDLEAECRVASPRTPAQLLHALAAAVDGVVGQLGPGRSSVAGIGIGVPGLVTLDGLLYDTPNLRAERVPPSVRASRTGSPGRWEGANWDRSGSFWTTTPTARPQASLPSARPRESVRR